MQITHDDFIGIYEGALSGSQCDKLIEQFEQLSVAGFALDRLSQSGADSTHQDDTSVFATGCINIGCINVGQLTLIRELNDILWNSLYADYARKYSILSKAGPHGNSEVKLQKTEIGQGFHEWHFESATKHSATRLITWLAYLNDVDEGGETEFLYLHKRVKPKKGTVVLFPCGYTHTHRGNPPLSNTKYAATGWIEY